MRRLRALSLLAITGATLWACTEGPGPTDGGGRFVQLDLVPNFQLDPSLFSYDPINRIRLVAMDVETSVVVGSLNQAVDPSAGTWSLALAIDLGGAASRQVIVEIELFSGASVEWSGRAGPFTVGLGSLAQGVDVYRGPLDNFDVVSVDVDAPPSQLLVGESTSASASVTLVAGSDATPVVFWASADPTVASVAQEGSTTTITGVAPGTTEIIAAAGETFFEFSLVVLASSPAGTRTWVGGDADDPTGWGNPDNWNPVGVPGPSDAVVVNGTGTVPRLSAPRAVASIAVPGLGGVDLNGFTLTVTGDADGGPDGFLNGPVLLVGPGTVLQGSFTDLEIAADRSVSGPTYVLGDLTISDALLDTNAELLSTTGDLFVDGPGGVLSMTGGSAVVSVSGDATFNGGSHQGRLTDGFLGIGGHLTATDASPTSFVSSGNHLVAFQGSSVQNVIFEIPGLTEQRLGEVYLSNNSGVTFQTDMFMTGSIGVLGWMTVPGGTTADVTGTVTLFSGSTLEVDGTLIAAECDDQGATFLGSGTHPCDAPPAVDRTWLGGTAAWSDPDNWSPTGVPNADDDVFIPSTQFQPLMSSNESIGSLTVAASIFVNQGGFTLTVARDVDLAGGSSLTSGLTHLDNVDATQYSVVGTFDHLRVSAPRTLAGIVTTSGDLDVRSELTIGPNTAVVNGDLIVQTADGSLIMTEDQQGSSSVGVFGNSTFSGASSVGNLTGGVIQALGDFTATSTHSPTSFQSGGTFVYLTPQGDIQSITFDNPGPNGQSFDDVYVFQGQNSVTRFESDALVTGMLLSGNAQLQGATGAILEVTGVLDLDVVTFNNLPLRLVSDAGPGQHILDNVTFTSMPPYADHLRIEIPGAGNNVPLNINSPVFATAPGNGFFHLRAVNKVPAGQRLHVELFTPTPSPPPAAAYTAGTNVEVIWP